MVALAEAISKCRLPPLGAVTARGDVDDQAAIGEFAMHWARHPPLGTSSGGTSRRFYRRRPREAAGGAFLRCHQILVRGEDARTIFASKPPGPWSPVEWRPPAGRRSATVRVPAGGFHFRNPLRVALPFRAATLTGPSQRQPILWRAAGPDKYSKDDGFASIGTADPKKDAALGARAWGARGEGKSPGIRLHS